MQDRMSLLPNLLIWVAFFTSSVYGHIGFKLAAESGADGLWGMLLNPWSITAILAWGGSAIVWMLILSKNPLVAANMTSALSHAMIAVIGVLLFKEALTLKQGIGIFCVIVGVYLVNA